MNLMRDIRVEKVVLNIGCGTALPIENAKTILEGVAKRKVMIIKTRKRSTFNVPKGKDMGCMITIRKEASDFLKKLLLTKDNIIKSSSFDSNGNFAFGVNEYIDVPGMDYDPKVGIIGFDACVTLERPGFRVKKKKINRKIGKRHRISKEEAVKFISEKFGVKVV